MLLAGSSTPVVAALQLLVAPGDLRLSLLTGWLARSEVRAVLPLLHRVELALIILALIFVAARTGALRLLARAVRGAFRSWLARADPGGLGLDHVAGPPERSAPVPPPSPVAPAGPARPGRDGPARPAAAGTPTCWDGTRPLPRRLRRQQDPTGALIRVTTITGPVGRTTVGGRPYTVCTTGRRLRADVPYVVLGREGDVLIVATDVGD